MEAQSRQIPWGTVTPYLEENMSEPLGIKMPGTFRLTITVGVLVVAAIGAIILIYLVAPSRDEQLKFVASVVAGGAGLYAAYYLGAALHLQIKMEQQHRSFEILERTNEVDVVRVRRFIEEEIAHKKLSSEETYKKIVDNDEIRSGVRSLLGMIEDISIAIQSGYVNEKIMYYSLGLMVPYSLEKLQPYIQKEREFLGNQSLFHEAEKLGRQWVQGDLWTTGERMYFHL
jgi:hypothetical protein